MGQPIVKIPQGQLFLWVWYNLGIMSTLLEQLRTRRDECFELATAREAEAVDGNEAFWRNWRILAIEAAVATAEIVKTRELIKIKD